MDEKRKLSKKEDSSSSSFARSFSTKSSSTSSKAPHPPLKRSSSLKIFGSSSSPKRPLPRSSSLKDSPPKISRSFSQKARKCTSMAKERKARFYIMRRCVAMLVCWHENGD